MIEEIILKSVKLTNGETTGYRERKHGNSTIFLIHGNMTSSKHWDMLMEKIPKNYKIIAIDLRGFGISSYNTPVTSLKDFSQDIKLFADTVGLERFTLAGWSAGGAVAMQFTADYPQYVSRLVLVESVGIKGYPMLKFNDKGEPLGEFIKTKEDVKKQIAPIVNAVTNKDKAYLRALWNKLIYTQKQPSPEKYEEYLEDMLMQRNHADVYHALIRFNISNENNGIVNGSGEVDKIDVPTLVLQGDKDRVISVMMAKETADGIGDNAKLVVLENCGHSPLTDCPDKLILHLTTRINAFL